VKIWGLTGNIGAGKSTVARLLVAGGIPVVDADLIAREVVQPGQPALADIRQRFGPGVILPDGALDRKAVAARVFGHPEELKALNAIVHPRIAERTAQRMSALEESGAKVAVYEAALLVENNSDLGMDGLVVVTAPVELQIARLHARDGLTEAEARARIAAQMPAEEKVKRATVVIENRGSQAELAAQVEALISRLRA
jgi:dephospho-CoA kinase